ncbi:MAG: hypothetical protein J0L75_00640 [Spirochaetes bacterium]|nr:hypothetical protein [Spirochaetota bacterium]
MPANHAPYAFCLSAWRSHGAAYRFFKKFPQFEHQKVKEIEETLRQGGGAAPEADGEVSLFEVHVAGGQLNQLLGGTGPAENTTRHEFMTQALDNKLDDKKQLYWTAGMLQGRPTLHLIGRTKKGMDDFHKALVRQAKTDDWDGTLHDWASCLKTLGFKAIADPSY